MREQREIGRLVGDLYPRRSHRWSKSRAAIRAAGVSASIVRSRRSATTWSAPPSSASVAARSVKESRDRSTSHSLCMTSWRYGASIPGARPFVPCAPRPPGPSSTRPVPHPVEHGCDELVLDRNGLALELFPAVEWLYDRGTAGVAVEAIEAEDVPEQVGDRALQTIEGRKRVLAQRQQDIHAQRSVDQVGQGAIEAVPVRRVGEVLLGLIQDEVDVAVGLRARRDVEERAWPDPAASAIAFASACSGDPLQLEKTKHERPLGSRRKARATLARSSDDCRHRQARTAPSGATRSGRRRRSRSRAPGRRSRARRAPSRRRSQPPVRRLEVHVHALKPPLEEADVRVRLHVENVDVEAAREGLLQRARLGVERRRAVRERPVAQTRCITSRSFQSTISYPINRKWLRRRWAASATGTEEDEISAPR